MLHRKPHTALTLGTQITITELDLWFFFAVFTLHFCQRINDIVYMQQKHMHLFIHIEHVISIHINGLFILRKSISQNFMTVHRIEGAVVGLK